MAKLTQSGTLDVGGQTLEYRAFGPTPPTFILLHEGLGSADLWGTFPSDLAAATGVGVFAYSRAGYGASSPVTLPRPFSYMHDEALDTLPKVLDAIGFERGVLIGCSDGASIATIFAGHANDDRVVGLCLMAPHFFVENETVAGAAAARKAYEVGDLRAKLSRWHTNVDVAFRGWNDAWLDPSFKASWNITDALPEIRVPMLIIQGDQDDYGTRSQIEAAQHGSFSPVEAVVMPSVGHAPYREACAACVAAIAAFSARVVHSPARFR